MRAALPPAQCRPALPSANSWLSSSVLCKDRASTGAVTAHVLMCDTPATGHLAGTTDGQAGQPILTWRPPDS